MARISSVYIYLAVALGLICYLTFIDKKIPGTKEAEQQETELFKFATDDVTGLEVSNVHGVFIFKKENNHWEIKAPVITPADGPTVEQVLNEIAFAQPQRVIKIDGSNPGDQANLKEWGLSPAAERVVIHTPTKNYELQVGRKTAINDSVYARASGRKNESVRIIPLAVKDILQKDLSSFRSRGVFDFDTDKVTKVASQIANTATTPAQECEVDLDAGKWSLHKPLMARASESDVQTMLNKIIGLRVTDFITDDASNLSQYGLTDPAATLSLTLKPADEQVLQIGGAVPGKTDQVYAHRLKSNSVFTLEKAAVDEVFKAVPNVRDRRVLPFAPGQAKGLTYSYAAKSAELKNEKGVWKLTGRDGGRADAGKVSDLLTKLSQLETTPVLQDSPTDLKRFGLDKPAGKITLQAEAFKPDGTLTLSIGKDENKLLYVRNSLESCVYTVPDNSFDLLPANALALRDLGVVNLDLKQVASMTVTVANGTPVKLARSEGGTWTPTNVKDRMVNSGQADVQASLLCQLQAAAWLGPVLPAYGLAKPVLTLALESTQPNAPATTVLHIGAQLPDKNHAAQIEGDATAFELSDGDYSILNASSIQLVPAALSGTNAPSSTPAATNSAAAKK
jgi:hypothetical protein